MSTWTPNTRGIWFDLPGPVYRKAPGLSQSALKSIEPPARFPAQFKKVQPVTPWMRMGTMIHHMVLEPDKQPPAMVVKPEFITDPATGKTVEWNGRTTLCKRWVADREAAGIMVMDADELERVQGCVQAIADHPVAREYAEMARTEVSVFSYIVTDHGDVLVKCRPDMVVPGVMLDIKKVGVGMADRYAFERLAWERDYHVQAASYMANWNEECSRDAQVRLWLWIAVEDEYPHLVNVIRAEDDLIRAGLETYLRRVDTFAKCTVENKWPGYQDGVKSIGVPGYARRERYESHH